MIEKIESKQIDLVQTALLIKSRQTFLRTNRRTVGRKARRTISREIHELIKQYNAAVGFTAIKW